MHMAHPSSFPGRRTALALLLFSVASPAGCGGYSTEDAKTYCDQEQQALAFCFTDAVYQECIDCYVECGVDCDRQATCPEEYVCTDD